MKTARTKGYVLYDFISMIYTEQINPERGGRLGLVAARGGRIGVRGVTAYWVWVPPRVMGLT